MPLRVPWPLRGGLLWGVGLLAGGCGAGDLTAPLERFPTVGEALGLLAGSVLLNALVTVGALAAWHALTRRRRAIAQLKRELRHLRHWAGVEASTRKTGLLRDLNDLGAIPAELEGCQLAGADLRGLRLAGCMLRGANLAGADLQGADLQGADLFGADLSAANLGMATLREANLRGVTFTDANLVKARLSGANLHRAELVNADLSGAELSGARLELARFALRESGLFQQAVHPSVEDWIRARLDGEGRYSADAAADAATPLPEAG